MTWHRSGPGTSATASQAAATQIPYLPPSPLPAIARRGPAAVTYSTRKPSPPQPGLIAHAHKFTLNARRGPLLAADQDDGSPADRNQPRVLRRIPRVATEGRARRSRERVEEPVRSSLVAGRYPVPNIAQWLRRWRR